MLSLWRCGQGTCLVHHIHRLADRVGFAWRSTAMGGMRPLGVVEVDPLGNDSFGLEAVSQLVQVNRLVFERAPQAFDKDVVHAPTPAVHGDRDVHTFQHTGEVEAGELAALIGVEDLRPSVSSQRFLQRLHAEGGIHGVRQSPRQDVARRPVHDRHQIQESALDRDVGDAGASDLIGPSITMPLSR
jgi:hypothetical protein